MVPHTGLGVAARNLIALPVKGKRVVVGNDPLFDVTQDRGQIQFRRQLPMLVGKTRHRPRDATPQNMGVLWEYLEKNGRMVDVYTDRDSMFTVTPHTGESRQQRVAADRLTQLGRSLRELGIGWIAAYSPQAKGRIERSFLTAQDRLVKQL